MTIGKLEYDAKSNLNARKLLQVFVLPIQHEDHFQASSHKPQPSMRRIKVRTHGITRNSFRKYEPTFLSTRNFLEEYNPYSLGSQGWEKQYL
jgi:hypothetical protein